eukprot:5003549-Amphidinium_carterae.1
MKRARFCTCKGQFQRIDQGATGEPQRSAPFEQQSMFPQHCFRCDSVRAITSCSSPSCMY